MQNDSNDDGKSLSQDDVLSEEFGLLHPSAKIDGHGDAGRTSPRERLYAAVHALSEPRTALRRHPPQAEALRTWALHIAARRGNQVAVVALARRLAGILYALLRAVVSYDGDFVIHFNDPTLRSDRNDPATATRVAGRKVPSIASAQPGKEPS